MLSYLAILIAIVIPTFLIGPAKDSNIQEANKKLQQYQAENGIVVLFYSAEWCSFCKRAKPIFDALDKQGFIKLVVVDVDKEDSSAYGDLVTYVPKITVFRKTVSDKVGRVYHGDVPSKVDDFIHYLFEHGDYNEDKIKEIVKPICEG